MGIMRNSGKVGLIPLGSRSQPGMLVGVGPGLCGLPRILLLGTRLPPRRHHARRLKARLTRHSQRTSENAYMKLSEKSRAPLRRSPVGRQRATFRSISPSVYQPNSWSERWSYPFSDSFCMEFSEVRSPLGFVTHFVTFSRRWSCKVVS